MNGRRNDRFFFVFFAFFFAQLDAIYQSGPLAPWYDSIEIEAFRLAKAFQLKTIIMSIVFNESSSSLLWVL